MAAARTPAKAQRRAPNAFARFMERALQPVESLEAARGREASEWFDSLSNTDRYAIYLRVRASAQGA